MKLVSIILGTYNGEKYIHEQITSLLNQTYTAIEIVVVDDNSEDKTLEIIRNIASPKIKIHSYKENVGYIKNFERGLQLAKGDFICFSDQDDWWFEDKIKQLVQKLENATEDLIYCDSVFTNESLEQTGESFATKKNMIHSNNPLHFVVDNSVSGHALLFKKSLTAQVLPFPDCVPHDWWVAFVASANNGIMYHNHALVKYRFHDSNTLVSKKYKKDKTTKYNERRRRMKVFAQKCPESFKKEKIIITKLSHSYSDFSAPNTLYKLWIIAIHYKSILKIPKNKFLYWFKFFTSIK